MVSGRICIAEQEISKGMRSRVNKSIECTTSGRCSNAGQKTADVCAHRYMRVSDYYDTQDRQDLQICPERAYRAGGLSL